MVQGYAQQNSGSEGGWAFFLSSRTAEEGNPSAGTTENRSYISRPYTCGTSYDQWTACLPEESKLSVNKAERYPIDNNAAERAVRPLTTQRNSMLHFGSDEGAKMAATYHSIISTVKLQGRSAWDYLGKFFVNLFNGCRVFFSLRPGNIGLATCQ